MNMCFFYFITRLYKTHKVLECPQNKDSFKMLVPRTEGGWGNVGIVNCFVYWVIYIIRM